MFDTHTQDPRVRRLLDTVSNRQSIRRQHSDEDATYETWTLNDIEKLFNDIRAEHVTEIRHLKDQVETERRGRLAAEKMAREARDGVLRVMSDILDQQRCLGPQAQASSTLIDYLLGPFRGLIGRLGWLPQPQAVAQVPANDQPNDHETNTDEDVPLREAFSDASSTPSQSPRVTSTLGREPLTPESPVPRKRKATSSFDDGDHPQSGPSPPKAMRTRSMTSVRSSSSTPNSRSSSRKGKRKTRQCEDGLTNS